MIYYEIKKVFSRTGNKIAVFLLGIVLIVTVFFAITGVEWVDEEGESHTGFLAISNLREAKRQWNGPLTEEKLAEAVLANQEVNALAGGKEESVRESNILYGKKQGFSDIRRLLNRSFCAFRDYDYYKMDTLSPEAVGSFYGNRADSLRIWLDTEAKDVYTDAEKDFLIARYEALDQPWDYRYHDGWTQIISFAPTIQMLLTIILAFVTAGIFSCETQLRADAVFFTSYHGRNKAVSAKLKAGFLIVTGTYWLLLGLYTAAVLGTLGAEGAGCVIQMEYWRSIYNITFLQAYLLMLFGGYIGCLFLSLLVMLAAAKTKTSVFAVSIPLLFIFLPSFFGFFKTQAVTRILGLLPEQLLGLSDVFTTFCFYKLGGKIYGSIGLLMLLYSIGSLLLFPALYRIYVKTQVR